MSPHNICFHGEIRKILCGYPLLSGAMYGVPTHMVKKQYISGQVASYMPLDQKYSKN